MPRDKLSENASTESQGAAGGGMSRRELLRRAGITGLATLAASVLPAQARPAFDPRAGRDAQVGHTAADDGREPAPLTLDASPIRPPAVPLAVRQPYVSTWLPETLLPGTWPQFWQGSPMRMAGIIRIDGTAYLFMGDPKLTLDIPDGNHGKTHTAQDFPRALAQTALETTPTRSRFELRGGGVGLTVEFLSPVEPGDMRRQSIPLSYVRVAARSLDGQPHDVQVYMDLDDSWVSPDPKQAVGRTAVHQDGFRAWALSLEQSHPLAEDKQFPAWGTTVWAAQRHAGLSYQSGDADGVRQRFVDHGRLENRHDADTPDAGKHPPVCAFCADLGRVGHSGAHTWFVVGQVRDPAIQYMKTRLRPLWSAHFRDWQAMLTFFLADAGAAARRADRLDARIVRDARAAGGRTYEGLCALALRQAYGGTELVVGPDGEPWAFLKEISSDGNVSTVDVLYPASPVWMYLDPDYLRLLLTPLLSYAEKGGWPKSFAEHDLGASYPQATGHNNGREEDMPVEESANMLIMVAAYLQRTSGSDARAFARRHYRILGQWADYLTRNLPDPGFQNQTDDFAGFIAHSVNLALKGIIAVSAMGRIARLAGHADDAGRYQKLSHQYITHWLQHAQDPRAAHLDLTYNGEGGGTGTWGTVYNGFADRLLGTGLIPDPIRRQQAAWYAKVSNPFGLPLQVPHSYAKSDWELFTAAWLYDQPVKQQLIDRVYAYANTTPDRVPFSDLYSTVTGRRVAFEARPVQGGIYALLAIRGAPNT